jgi:hypothetical protein
MDIKVTVSKNRKCPASIDWRKEYPKGGIYIMSFGDLSTPDNDVEIEFTEIQLVDLQSTIRTAQEKVDHSGWC